MSDTTATRQPVGIHYVTEEDTPVLIETFDGGVLLSVSCDLALRFRTAAAFEEWLQDVLRQSVNP